MTESQHEKTAADAPADSPYAVTLDALERSAHVAPEDRVAEVDSEPSDAGVWDGELYRRQHDALRAGG